MPNHSGAEKLGLLPWHGHSACSRIRHSARLCHLAGGELRQIQFLLGHASVQTTEQYLGCKQKINQAVNDNLGLEDT
jgi:integrase